MQKIAIRALLVVGLVALLASSALATPGDWQWPPADRGPQVGTVMPTPGGGFVMTGTCVNVNPKRNDFVFVATLTPPHDLAMVITNPATGQQFQANGFWSVDRGRGYWESGVGESRLVGKTEGWWDLRTGQTILTGRYASEWYIFDSIL